MDFVQQGISLQGDIGFDQPDTEADLFSVVRHIRREEHIPGGPGQAEPFLSVLRRTFAPHKVVVVAREGSDQERQSRLVPLLAGKVARRGKTTAYVCEGGTCKLPTSDVQEFERQIRGDGEADPR